jgi:hypothetical protein
MCYGVMHGIRGRIEVVTGDKALAADADVAGYDEEILAARMGVRRAHSTLGEAEKDRGAAARMRPQYRILDTLGFGGQAADIGNTMR